MTLLKVIAGVSLTMLLTAVVCLSLSHMQVAEVELRAGQGVIDEPRRYINCLHYEDFGGHRYVVYGETAGYAGASRHFIHDPDCPCHK